MKITHESPELTAYALNELDPQSKSQVEAAISNDPSLAKEVEAIRALGSALTQELHAEEAPQLTDKQKSSLKSPDRNLSMKWPRFTPLLAAAAAVAIAVGGVLLIPSLYLASKPQEYEEIETPDKDKPISGQNESLSTLKDAGPDSPTPPARPSPTVRPSPQKCPVVKREFAVLTKKYAGKSRLAETSQPEINGWVYFEGDKEEGVNGQTPGTPFGPSIEHYNQIVENPFRRVSDEAFSTFSIDVDTAAYSNMRRFLSGGSLPPPDAVRIEELINYFNYAYAPTTDGHPFATHFETIPCPWKPGHQIVRIGIKGREMEKSARPNCNLVFLLDVSGSMNQANKLPLVARAMKMLVQNLNGRDRVAIVVYAGASGLVLPSTACDNPQAIIDSLERLKAGGSTNGGAGIELAYKTAMENYIEEGVNRVILCTDGDFNVGVTQSGGLVRMVEERAKKGVFLSVLGFGMGNYKDSTLEQIADKGNGNYAYIDTFNEARKVLVNQLTGTLITIAKDVKIQVVFNPAKVAGYRLIGYENRMLRKEDFNDDTKDAGEIGAGHRVTALYEIVPFGMKVSDAPNVDPSPYKTKDPAPTEELSTRPNELMQVRIRYKQPDSDTSTKMVFPLMNNIRSLENASDNTRFACAVASFGMLLRNSKHAGNASFDGVIEMADSALGEDNFGYRREFIDLVRSAKALKGE